MFEAHVMFNAAAEQAPSLVPLADKVQAARTIMVADVEALVARSLISNGKLTPLAGPVGYHNIASDVSTLGYVLQNHWPSIRNKTGASFEEITASMKLAL
jgi:hypothetical protein